MLCCILFGLIVIALCYFAIRYTYFWRINVPCVAPKMPFILGSISREKHLALQFDDFYKSHRTDHPIIGIYIMDTPCCLVVDLNLIQRILTVDFPHFQNRGMYNNKKDDPLSAILGSLEHDNWKLHRPKLTQAFTSAKLKRMFPIITAIGKRLVSTLNELTATNEDITLEIRDFVSRFTTDVIGTVAIGIDCNIFNDLGIQLRKMSKKAMKPYLSYIAKLLTIAHPDIARMLGIRKHAKDVTDFFMNILQQEIQRRERIIGDDDDATPDDFLQSLIDSDLTTQQISAFTFDLLSAGYGDSTATLGI